MDMRKEEDGSEHLGSLSLNFSVSLREEEGGGIHNLIPNGADCSVTPDNIFLYIQKYAELRMIKVHQEPLEVSGVSIGRGVGWAGMCDCCSSLFSTCVRDCMMF